MTRPTAELIAFVEQAALELAFDAEREWNWYTGGKQKQMQHRHRFWRELREGHDAIKDRLAALEATQVRVGVSNKLFQKYDQNEFIGEINDGAAYFVHNPTGIEVTVPPYSFRMLANHPRIRLELAKVMIESGLDAIMYKDEEQALRHKDTDNAN